MPWRLHYKAEGPHISVLQQVLHLDSLAFDNNWFHQGVFVWLCLVSRTLNTFDIFRWICNFSNVFPKLVMWNFSLKLLCVMLRFPNTATTDSDVSFVVSWFFVSSPFLKASFLEFFSDTFYEELQLNSMRDFSHKSSTSAVVDEGRQSWFIQTSLRWRFLKILTKELL